MKKYKFTLLLFLVSFIGSEVMTSIPSAAGQFGPYLGDSNINNPPSFKFSLENETEIYTVGLYSVGFLVEIGAPVNSCYIPGGGITSVSYKASWQDKPKEVWQWSINSPGVLSDDDPNSTVAFFYAIDLSDVPEGPHEIEVFATGVGYGYPGGGYSIFSTDGSESFHFSAVAPPSSESPDPGNLSSVWDIQTVAGMGAGGYVFNSPLIVLDSNDVPHIAYSKLVDYPNSPTRFTMYSSWNGFAWTSQTVGIGTPYDLVLDENDTPHLVYGEIEYATISGTNWVTQTIEQFEPGIGKTFGVIALDSSDTPHVVYSYGDTVKYASKKDSTWNIQLLDSVEFKYISHFQLSLAFDQNDSPYVMYSSTSSYVNENLSDVNLVDLKLAVYKNSRWNIETMPLPPPINGYGNMVLDSTGNPHFICSQLEFPSRWSPRSNVLYVHKNDTEWDIQEVVSNVTLGIYSENGGWINMGFLALDSNDYPKICYSAKSENESDYSTNLLYASWTGNSWNIQTVDPDTQAKKPGFFVLDSNDNPHISYIGPRAYTNWLSYSYADVRYATSTMFNEPVETEEPPESGQSLETSLISTETAILLVAITASIIGSTVYWFLQKRHNKK